MKLNVSDEWMSVESPISDSKAHKLRMVIALLTVIGIVITLFVLMWQEQLLIDSSGETVTYFYLGVIWDIIIVTGSLIGVPVIVYILFKNCHNVSGMIDVSFILTLGALAAAHFIIEGIWFCITIGGTAGYLYTIYAMEIAIQFLIAMLALTIVGLGASMIYSYKKDCDVVVNGISMPTAYASGSGLSARVQCKELNGKKMCKIPRIDSIE